MDTTFILDGDFLGGGVNTENFSFVSTVANFLPWVHAWVSFARACPPLGRLVYISAVLSLSLTLTHLRSMHYAGLVSAGALI